MPKSDIQDYIARETSQIFRISRPGMSNLASKLGQIEPQSRDVRVGPKIGRIAGPKWDKSGNF